MIEFDKKLPCGTRLEVYQPEPNMIIMVRLSVEEGNSLSKFVAIKDNRISIAVDPENIPTLIQIFDMFRPPFRLSNFRLFLAITAISFGITLFGFLVRQMGKLF